MHIYVYTKAKILDASKLWQFFILSKCVKPFILLLLSHICQFPPKDLQEKRDHRNTLFPSRIFTWNCISHVLSNWAWLSDQRITCQLIFFATKPLLFYSLVGLVPLHFTPAGQTHYSDQISGLLYSQRQISKENLKRPFQKWYRKMWHVIKQLAIKFFHAAVML